MNEIELLGAALGLGALSGISLYLTVFVVGVSLSAGWLHLAPGLEALQVLDHPAIWVTAGLFYLLEFFADKVPWVDSFWDTIHTAIRPVGAMFVASAALGETDRVMEVMGILLAGGAAAATHAMKAGTRLVINASPEPFTNVAASVTEDAIVIGGTIITLQYPYVALGFGLAVIALALWLVPVLFRVVVNMFRVAWGFLRTPAGPDLPNRLPAAERIALSRHLVDANEEVLWAVPCTTGKFPSVGRNVYGWLVGTTDRRRVYFVGPRFFRMVVGSVPLAETRMDREQGFVFDDITLYRTKDGVLAQFRFHRTDRARFDAVVERLGGASGETAGQSLAVAPV